MKKIFLIVALLCTDLFALFAQNKKFDYSSYKQIPSELIHQDSLFKYIIPDKSYTYWECVETSGVLLLNYGDVIFYKGNQPFGVSFKNPGYGFWGSPPYSKIYIPYIKDGEIGYVTSIDELKTFIGDIDNFQEAILLAETSDAVRVDTDMKGGAYKETSNGYELVLMHYNNCPETYEAIHFTVENSKILKKENLGVYKNPGGCWIY